MPASSPPCSGANGTMDSPNCRQAGASSCSAARSMRLYFTWAQTGAVQPPVVGDPQRVRELPGRMVGQRHVPELTLPHQVVVHRKRLFQRRVGIGVVRVVEVDVVRFQPPQTVLDLLDDVPARQPPVIHAGTDLHARLGGDHHVVTPASERAAEDLLGRLTFGRGRDAWPIEG